MDKGVEHQFVKNLKSRVKEKRGQENSKPRADRKVKYQFLKNPKPCAKERKNSFKSRAEKNSKYKIHQKILNLVRNKCKILGIIAVKNLE